MKHGWIGSDRFCNENAGIIIPQHIADHGGEFKIIHKTVYGRAGTGHLEAHRTVAVEDGFDIVQFQMLLRHDGIKYITQILGNAAQISCQKGTFHCPVIGPFGDGLFVDLLIRLRK